MHSSLQSMLISKLNSWYLDVTSVKQQSMPALTPSCLPLFRRRRLHSLYSSCIILLLAPNKLVSNRSTSMASQVAPMVKNLPADEEDIRDAGSIPGSGRSPGERHGNPLQQSCLENPMDRGARWGCNAWGHSQTRLR